MNRDIRFLGSDVVVATDFSQGIGPGPADQLKLPLKTVVSYMVRSAVCEILAIGALPEMLVFSNSIQEGGYEVIAEVVESVKTELRLPSLQHLVSTEKNFKPTETALAITCLGRVDREELKEETPEGAALAIVGEPLVGSEVLEGDLPTLAFLKEFIRFDGVYEILPVGSQGLSHELKYFTDEDLQLPFDGGKSAGPTTCLLVSYDPKVEELIRTSCSCSFHRIR